MLFLDEPTKGLDAASAAQATRIIRALANDGAAIAVATHDTAFVRVAADDVSLVFDGVVACILVNGKVDSVSGESGGSDQSADREELGNNRHDRLL